MTTFQPDLDNTQYENSENRGISLTPLISEGAVLQRNKPVILWGHAEPETVVEAVIADRAQDETDEQSAAVCTGTCMSDRAGAWKITLPSHQAGGPYDICLMSAGEKICIHDVLFGDVWLLSGQSNMQLWLGRLLSAYPHVLEEIHDTSIRVFIVPEQVDFVHKHDDLNQGHWLIAGKDNFFGVSGIGYFFAEKIRQVLADLQQLSVPVGLVSTALGGSHIESWMSRESLEGLGFLSPDFVRLTQKDYIESHTALYKDYADRYERMMDSLDKGLSQHWERPEFDDSSWKAVSLQNASHEITPDFFQPGVTWLRKKIFLPQEFIGKKIQLRLGTLTDADSCYACGKLIGQTTYKYPPREYSLTVQQQELILAVRLVSYGSQGGFTAHKKHLLICQGQELDLDAWGDWKIKQSVVMPVRKEQEFYSHLPVGDFNGMIYPLKNLSFAGVLWYQGESNTSDPIGYSEKFMALIQEWRALFHDQTLPFIFAQLPNYSLEPFNDWPRLRDEQRRTLALSNTAMAVTIGLGEDNDLHPVCKKDVAVRMAQAAESLVYKNGREGMGPLPVGAVYGSNYIEVRFSHVGSGLVAAADMEFTLLRHGCASYKAVLGPETIKSSDRIRIPLPDDILVDRDSVLRYGWEQSPVPVLKNSCGLPASPFEIHLVPAEG